jgi:Putative Ig domain
VSYSWGQCIPNGLGAFTSNSPNGDIVTVTSPGDQSSTDGQAVSLPVNATDTAPSQRLGFSATGLPDGLAVNSLTGVISGTPSTPGVYSVLVTARDALGVSGGGQVTDFFEDSNALNVS